MPLFRFCPRCGHELPHLPADLRHIIRQDCPACGEVHFQNAKPCAGALVIREGKVLLGRRGIDPFKGWWDIPGGFLEPWEHPADGAMREVVEETGLVVRTGEILDIIVDTYGEGGDYTINIFFLAEVVSGEAKAGDDIVELRWFGPDELPDEVAFTNGPMILNVWRQRVATH
ncbi:MAG: NUDIX hydrolase [Dehalococcoidia bacterium]|nr:NUDIX hydrolase [Dehalococcoidia bacterium]